MNKEELFGKTLNCKAVGVTKGTKGNATFYNVELEVPGFQENPVAFSSQSFETGVTYPVTFTEGKNSSLVASRPKNEVELREERKRKEQAEKEEYERDNKARGISTDGQSEAAPAAGLITPANERQVLLAKTFGFGPEDVRIMEQNSIVPPGTPITQVEYFFRTAQLMGANPLLKQVYLIGYGPAGKKSYSIVTSIDHMRNRALKTGQYGGCSKVLYDGMTLAEWVKFYGNKRTFKSVGIQKSGGGKTWTEYEQHLETGEFPQVASMIVTRFINGVPCQFEAEIAWEEYYPGPGGRGQMWRERPHGQLGKCVEAIALRKAFADSMSKMHISEEMDRRAAQEEAKEVSAEVIDMRKIIAEIQALDTLQELLSYKDSHPEFASDPEFLEALAARNQELQNQ